MELGAAADAPGGAAEKHPRGPRGTTPAHLRSVELTHELATARVEAVLAMRELQRVTMAGVGLETLGDAAEVASLATARLAGFARMLAATLPKLT